MSSQFPAWLVLLAAACGANLPFFTRRVLGLVALPDGRRKGLPAELLELVGLYFVVGILGLLLERHGGQIAPQGWEFYAVTAALFVTLAFPGFIYRHLVRNGRHG